MWKGRDRERTASFCRSRRGRSWAATVSVPWLSLSVSSGTDSTNIIFGYDANPGATRTGTIVVGAQTVTITQAGSTYVAAGQLTTLVDASAGLYFPNSCGLDGAGNYYISDGSDTGAVHKCTKANNTLTPLISTGLKFPFGIAVDNPGDVFLMDGGENQILKWTAASSNITTIVSSGLNGANRGAADAAGNLIFTDEDNNKVKKWYAADGSVSNLVSGLSQPWGVAVDAAGNVYYYDIGTKTIQKWNAANNTTNILASNITNAINNMAVDNGGNLYFADYGNNADQKVAGGRWQYYHRDRQRIILPGRHLRG